MTSQKGKSKRTLKEKGKNIKVKGIKHDYMKERESGKTLFKRRKTGEDMKRRERK